ncbi:MAG: hypothetical protein QM753_20950 [Thermomicrobiales bacterium]
MTDTTPTFTSIIADTDTRADAAIAFCTATAQGFPLGAALIAHRWRGGPADDAVLALARYQNADGGFGNGLEVDIAAPESNPFATRLAMQALLALDSPPARADAMLAGIDRYLSTAQDANGDFRFTPDVLAGEIAPWFAGWTYPNLSPSACLAGLASRLGIGTPDLFARVETMIANLGDPEVARNGEFYDVLPYAEYAPLLAANGHDALLAATADGIAARMRRPDGYDDAGHALDHALGGGDVLAARIPADLLAEQAQRLLSEQQDDGGWPSLYGPAWRPWITASALLQVATVRDMSR